MILVKNPRKIEKLERLVLMGRADGTPFTLMLNGRMHLALWPNTQSALHYRARNPELLVFSPALAATPSGQKNLAALQREDIGLFLLSDTGRSHFSDGRKVSWKEINGLLPASSLASASAACEPLWSRWSLGLESPHLCNGPLLNSARRGSRVW